jgi:tyrosyl-tRNA synthetase
MNVFDEFKWRGMVFDSSEGLEEVFATRKITGYIGFDPSAASLHVGSLLPVMNLVRLQKYGHTPIAILGGGTGMIGDPSGKTVERQLLSKEKIDSNLQGIREQLSRFLDFDAKANPAVLINNADWLLPVSMMDFLRDIGKYFTVNYMLAKESVKRRLEQEDGISFTEFSYMLLQAYDFLVLFDRNKCVLQMGGSDQWGNILAGMELIRRLRGEKAYGLVFPLVTTAAGVKFGKTEAGAVWLDANLTSPFKFYQFWFNTDDRDVVAYLKYFTLLDQTQIQELESSFVTTPEKREAQRKLAQEVTGMVHGETALQKALAASQALFGGEIAGLSAQEVADIFSDVPSSQLDKTQLEGDGISLVDLTIAGGFATSKGEARRLIEAGGINVNNRRIADVKANVNLSATVEGKFLVLRKGAKEYHLMKIGG